LVKPVSFLLTDFVFGKEALRKLGLF